MSPVTEAKSGRRQRTKESGKDTASRGTGPRTSSTIDTGGRTKTRLATDAGQSIRVPVSDISFRSRSAGGVRVFTTAADEHVVSVALVAENGDAEEE